MLHANKSQSAHEQAGTFNRIRCVQPACLCEAPEVRSDGVDLPVEQGLIEICRIVDGGIVLSGEAVCIAGRAVGIDQRAQDFLLALEVAVEAAGLQADM